MIEQLKEFGMSDYEARVINILLSERLNARDLSKKTKIPFGKIYSIIKRLKEINIVKETNSRPKLLYLENPSLFVDKLINIKQEKDKILFSCLRESVSNMEIESKKISRFFDIGTNVEDNKRIQLRVFSEAKEEVLQIINIHHKPNSNRTSKTIWEQEIEKAVKRGVKFKAIYPEKIILPTILEKLNKKKPESFTVKRLDTDFCRCDIVDGKKVLIKLVYKDPLQFGGIVLIENEDFADNLKKIFEELWREAE